MWVCSLVGDSGEHECSLASAQNVMDALRQAGYQVLPLGITREGRWLMNQDPMGRLQAAVAQLTDGAVSFETAHQLETNGRTNDRTNDRTNGITTISDSSVPIEPSSHHQAVMEPAVIDSTVMDVVKKQNRGWALIPSNESAAMHAIDVIFPVLHGPYGEDGTIQGLLEMLGFTLCWLWSASQRCGDGQGYCEKTFRCRGSGPSAYRVLMRDRWQQERAQILEQLAEELGFPVFVKPAIWAVALSS